MFQAASVNLTPFGIPVDPLVYLTIAMESGGAGPGSWLLARPELSELGAVRYLSIA